MSTASLPRRGLKVLPTTWSANFRKPLPLNRARERSASSVARETAEEGVEDDVTTRFPLYRPRPVEDTREMEARMIARSKAGPGNITERLKRFEMETKDLEIKLARIEKVKTTENHTADLPPYTEEQLELFYKALLTSPLEDTSLLSISSPEDHALLLSAEEENPKLTKEERKEVIGGVVARLERVVEEAVTLPGVQDDGERGISGGEKEGEGKKALVLMEVVAPEGEGEGVSLGIVSAAEVDALFEEFIHERDLTSAAKTLDLSKKCGIEVKETQIDLLLSSYALAGHITTLQRFITTHPSPPLSYHQHLLSAYLLHLSPSSSVTLLHTLEARQIFLPLSSYTAVIRSLLIPPPGTPLSQSNKALAWNLFAHTRLVAHPTPSVELYTLMIRSCADPRDPQPERALDIFTEMREESGIRPGRETFMAVILACARVKKFYAQSFRTLTEMLELHQSAMEAGIPVDPRTGRRISGFEPTIEVFNALLEGTKRMGDLPRARWILGEAVKAAKVGMVELGEDTLVGVFHTYASAQAVISRGDIGLEKKGKGKGKVDVGVKEAGAECQAVGDQEAAAASGGAIASQPETQDVPSAPQTSVTSDHEEADHALTSLTSPTFTPPTGPQSSPEILKEAERLFTLLLSPSSAPVFPRKIITPRLINAFLSIHFAHSPFPLALARWEEAWEEAGVERNGWSWMFALEAGAGVGSKTGRERAVEEVERLWRGWKGGQRRAMQGIGRGLYAEGYGAREVERAWKAVIKIYSINNQTKKALSLLSKFRTAYPPSSILLLPPTPPTPNPKIQLLSPLSVLEDDVPPHLLFHDLAALHQRLARDGDVKGVGLVKWVGVGYQKALETRRARKSGQVNYKKAKKGVMVPT